MENSLVFLYIVFFISIIFYVTAGFITLALVLPLQFKEAGIRNGLRRLRKQMLAKGALAGIVITASIIGLTSRFFISDVDTFRYIITVMILIHALGTLGKSIIDLLIYHQQYSPESKELHKKIEVMEDKRVADNTVARKKYRLDRIAEKGVK